MFRGSQIVIEEYVWTGVPDTVRRCELRKASKGNEVLSDDSYIIGEVALSPKVVRCSSASNLRQLLALSNGLVGN